MNPPKVFISYSHDSEEHNNRVLQLANALRNQGIDVELDRYHSRPVQGWPIWCEEQLRPENAAFVLMICTPIYRQRIENQTAADEGRGVYWEGKLIYNYLYNAKGNERFLPVLLPGTKEEDIPLPLQGMTRYNLEAFELSDPGYRDLYRELTSQPAILKPTIGAVVPLQPESDNNITALPALPARDVVSRLVQADISQIMRYAPERLIGRDDELAALDKAWKQAVEGSPGRPHVLTYVALGGEGQDLAGGQVGGQAGP